MKSTKKEKANCFKLPHKLALWKISSMHFGIAKLVLQVDSRPSVVLMIVCGVSVLQPNPVALVNHFIIKINFKLNPAQLKLNQKFAPIEMKRTKPSSISSHTLSHHRFHSDGVRTRVQSDVFSGRYAFETPCVQRVDTKRRPELTAVARKCVCVCVLN